MNIKKYMWLLALCSFTSFADSTIYQIDMILWVNDPQVTSSLNSLPMLTGDSANMIKLKEATQATTALYQLLPHKVSALQRQYWTLRHKPNYNIVAYYSWLQPSNNQRPVQLPSVNANGWKLEGNARVRISNYCLLNTELLFTKQDHTKTAFIAKQSIRLKLGKTYYLDHPSAGMLIQVHRI